MNLSPGLLALVAFGIINFMLISASCLVYAERKVSAFIQNRPGPNRVGQGGFFQPFADVFKLVFKEDTVPEGASRFVHALAPVIMVVIAMTVPALIPYARGVVIVDSAV
ncbi:MAG: NADH-quinone oxidoreductase subunit H, partial [Rhodothermaceae bacterium]|nr:NADH-quinone oxidoreductase subunit H [Rhodothermaceae bacterium]